jgi:pimeloyl-ACP methyl ester carboxylesterase
VSSAAGDVAAVVDSLGIDEFAVVGYAGGGTYALGCAAALGARARAVVRPSRQSPPYGADGLDWFAGMVPSGVAALGTAAAGRAVRAALWRDDYARTNDGHFVDANTMYGLLSALTGRRLPYRVVAAAVLLPLAWAT